MLKKKAYAKINLSLDVLGKLPNGYHTVNMIMQTVDIYDELTFESFEIKENNGCNDDSASEPRVDIRCINNSELSMGMDNLIYKAVLMLLDRIPENKGVKISLQKNIPIAAGMAGGSTDCAATLLGINELFDLGLSIEELCKIGTKLGADVPYCIKGGTMQAEGIGEKLTRLPDIPELQLVVAKPKAGVSTKYVYEHLDALENPVHPDVDGMIRAIKEGKQSDIPDLLGNILETVTIPVCPEVQEIKDILVKEGAAGVLMSGSGPTVFAIFEDDLPKENQLGQDANTKQNENAQAKAERAAIALEKNSPAEYIKVTSTISINNN